MGVRIDSGDYAQWAAGTYINSLDHQSLYVAREWTWAIAGPVDAGILGVGATGYRPPVMVAPLFELTAKLPWVEPALLVQPFKVRAAPAVFALQLRVPLHW